jgi:hypothetical protein
MLSPRMLLFITRASAFGAGVAFAIVSWAMYNTLTGHPDNNVMIAGVATVMFMFSGAKADERLTEISEEKTNAG